MEEERGPHLQGLLSVQGDPAQAGADAAHIGVHREVSLAKAQQQHAGHALPAQACTPPRLSSGLWELSCTCLGPPTAAVLVLGRQSVLCG